MNPRRAVLIGVLLLILGALSGRLIWGIARTSLEQARYLRIGGGIPAYIAHESQSKEYNEFADWLENDLAKRTAPWNLDDAEALRAILDARYTEDYIELVAIAPGATMRDQEPLLRYSFTESVIAERLRRNEPIEPEARRMLVMAMTDALEDPYYKIRLIAISSVCYARLVKDPEVRAKVEAMFNDPEPYVALGAREGLAHFDEIERLRAEGKWKEPWIKD